MKSDATSDDSRISTETRPQSEATIDWWKEIISHKSDTTSNPGNGKLRFVRAADNRKCKKVNSTKVFRSEMFLFATIKKRNDIIDFERRTIVKLIAKLVGQEEK